MALAFGLECFEMGLATNILAGIFATVLCLAAVGAVVLIVVAATIATMIFFTVDPHSAWSVAIAVGYLVVAVGAAIGISDYYE
jgi:predicted membrane chloride channel (bestrophin family)